MENAKNLKKKINSGPCVLFWEHNTMKQKNCYKVPE